MPNFFLGNADQLIFILNIIFALLAAAFLLLYIKEHAINNKLEKDPESILEKDRQRGYDIIHNAIQKAQAIIGQSELEDIKLTSSTKLGLESLENQQTQNLKETATKAKEAVDQSTEDFKSYLEYLNTKADQSVASNDQMLKDRVNQIVEKFEQNLSTYMTETQAQSSNAISLEMQAARQLIQTYKNEQFKLIDENIVAMLERTLSLVIAKKLSLKDHIELVYESLEKAKIEKFVV